MEPITAPRPDRNFESFADFYQNSAYSAFPQEHRSGGSFGLSMIRAEQQPIDLVDAAVPELVFVRTETDLETVLLDCGDGDKTMPGPANSFNFFPAHQESRTRVDVSHEVTILALDYRSVTDLLSNEGASTSAFDRYASKMTTHPAASSLMDRLWHSSSNFGPSASLFIDGLVLQLTSILIEDRGLSPLKGDQVADRRIARAIDYIEAHLAEPLTVAELAGIAALSPSQFSRVFKATTGQAVWTFVQHRRIERARTMLLHTQAPIARVAFECGFANQNHMTNLFKRHLGTTPGAIRKSD